MGMLGADQPMFNCYGNEKEADLHKSTLRSANGVQELGRRLNTAQDASVPTVQHECSTAGRTHDVVELSPLKRLPAEHAGVVDRSMN